MRHPLDPRHLSPGFLDTCADDELREVIARADRIEQAWSDAAAMREALAADEGGLDLWEEERPTEQELREAATLDASRRYAEHLLAERERMNRTPGR